MSAIVGFGPSGGAQRFQRTAARSIAGDGVGSIRYPSPFFDVAHTYLPSSFKTMLRWCRYYFLANPLVNAVCYKMAEYPVTDLVFDTDNVHLKNRWSSFFSKVLKFKRFEIEAGLDFNCFHGDVKAVTRGGVFRLRDLEGVTAEVLSQDGVWREATFKKYGQQELLEVEFGDGSTVLVTPTHEWPVLTSTGKIKKVQTTELEGRRLLRNVAPRPEKDEQFYEGVRHGFTFGDGSLYNTGKGKITRACANFCGAKRPEILKYFEGVGSPPTGPYENGVVKVHGLPAHFKKLPTVSMPASYWYGFVAGFLAADGSVDQAGCSVLTQASQATLEVIYDQLARLGMVGAPVRGYWRETEFGSGDMFYLSLFKQYMQSSDFLLSHHRRNFEENYKPTNYGKNVHVKAVRETGIVDDVFCCEEMETHTFTIGNGVLTGNCYGNCLVSIYYPFIKYLRCTGCKKAERVDRVRYTFRDYKFYGSCRHCGRYGDFTVFDHYIRSMKDIRLLRWNPEHITIQHNEATGENLYFYTIPSTLSNDIKMAKRHTIEKIPQIFIEALRRNKSLLFDNRNLYHLKRATISQKDKGWGLPMILPVLKDTFYLQILRKAQEAIAIEHIVPLRVLFPQSASGTSDVYSTINLQGWKHKVEQEILRWRLDNNYIPILPLPIGQQTLGAEGRALMLAQEYRVWAEHIIAGMGVPNEFVFGGMQYSGSNVSMRILENHFLDHRTDHDAMVDWIMENVGAYMAWKPVPHHFKRFKMADDLQRSAFNLQLNQAGKLSDRSLLEETDWDSEIEAERIATEQKKSFENQRRQALSQAEIQGEAQLAMQKYQLRAQKMMDKAMQEQGPPTPGGPAEMGMEPPMTPGIPGQMSPGAMGQQMNAQQEMMNQTGGGLADTPPIMPPEAGGAPPAGPLDQTQSPVNAGQKSQVPVTDPMALVTNPQMQDIADRIAAYLDQMSDAEKQTHMVQLRETNPQLYSLVASALSQRAGAHQPSTAMPQPQQRSPRRGPEATVGA